MALALPARNLANAEKEQRIYSSVRGCYNRFKVAEKHVKDHRERIISPIR